MVLKLEYLFELARSHEADLAAPVKAFSLPGSNIEIGDEPSLMGVVNLSPDSWYRESVCLNTNDAISRGKLLAAQGAAIVDVGGESTLHEAERVDAVGQSARLLPVITGLSAAGVAVSAETYNPEVAKQSLEAGASIINLTGAGEAEAIYEGGNEVPGAPFADPAAQVYPLVWTCPDTGRQALMPQPRCLAFLETKKGAKRQFLGMTASRRSVENWMLPAVSSDQVYIHDWQAGDLVLWFNRSVWHSATGKLASEDRRIMHLTAFNAASAPVCLRDQQEAAT